MVVDARRRVTLRASRHPRFSGLSEDDVEELFDATSEVVIGRPDRYANADHVSASLWKGMELRARDTFRRRRRRGVELDPAALELVPDDLSSHDDRISDEQELLVVRDFLAAMTPREADVWKLVHGEDLSVVQTSKRLGISRHATNEALEAAGRKLEVFLAIRSAGEWCGRRQSDITRMLDGSDDAGTARRATAHLQACTVCRREYAAAVRQTGRTAAGVLPLPAVVATEHGRSIVERVADLLPFSGGGGGRAEIIGGALLGGGGGIAGIAKVGAVVATTATVAVGAGSVVDRDAVRDEPRRQPTTLAAPGAGVASAPEPIATVVRVAPTRARATARETARRATSSTRSAARQQSRAVTRQREAERREDVFELGTIESSGSGTASSASAAPAPASAPAAPAPDPAGQEAFLP